MRILCFVGLFIYHSMSLARVTPTQIEPTQIKAVSEKLSGIFAVRTANDPNALGVDFELEISAFYQNLATGNLSTLDPSVSDQFLDSIITLKKGLYWNIDFSISTALPIPSNLTSGYSFNLEHTGKLKSFILKSDFYIAHYNLNDIINNETAGLSLILYKEFKFGHLGVGGNFESVSSTYNQNFLGSQLSASESNELEFVETALIAKASTRLGAFRFTGTYLSRNAENSLYNFSVGKRF